MRREGNLRLQRRELRWRDRLCGGLGELLGAGDATRQCRSRAQHNERVPFDTEGILQHLNATHQVYFHTLEGTAFTLEESDACLQGDPIQ